MQNSFGRPFAMACVCGGMESNVTGTVKFYPHPIGTLVVAEIRGLPESETNFYGFHIHEGSGCGGEDFGDTKGHDNPFNADHPNHAGDLPSLLGCKGQSYLAVLTDRFRPEEVVGMTAVLHSHPDDFRSQPSGDSGRKIACGVIRMI